MAVTPTPLHERFWPKVEVGHPLGCWVWIAGKTTAGYGAIGLGSRSAGVGYAHRVSYELLLGPIPDGLVLDHLCRNRSCVNPDHLEPVTLAENKLRGESEPARRARGAWKRVAA